MGYQNKFKFTPAKEHASFVYSDTVYSTPSSLFEEKGGMLYKHLTNI